MKRRLLAIVASIVVVIGVFFAIPVRYNYDNLSCRPNEAASDCHVKFWVVPWAGAEDKDLPNGNFAVKGPHAPDMLLALVASIVLGLVVYRVVRGPLTHQADEPETSEDE